MTKEKIIKKIKDIITNYGSFSPYEVSQDNPVIKTIGKDHNQVAEKFNLHTVDAISYVNELEVDENEIYYEDLTLELLEEILNIAVDYKVGFDKTMDKSRNENFQLNL